MAQHRSTPRGSARSPHDARLDDAPDDVVGFARPPAARHPRRAARRAALPAGAAFGDSLRGPEPTGPGDLPFGRLVTLGTAATWLDADSGGSFHPQGHRLPPVPTAHPAPHSLPVLLHAAAATASTTAACWRSS